MQQINNQNNNTTFAENNSKEESQNQSQSQNHNQEYQLCPTCGQIPFAGNMIRIGSGFTICPTCADFMRVFR